MKRGRAAKAAPAVKPDRARLARDARELAGARSAPASTLLPGRPDSLKDLQTRFAAAVMTPLTRRWTMGEIAPDGRPMSAYVEELVKPNDRLTSFERIELYNKQYWFRLIDVMYEDYAGLAAVLGRSRFNAFCREYLGVFPSKSPLLRNLGKNIIQFIDERPGLTAPRTKMARDMARFEWAQVEAFDAADKPALSIDDLLGQDPSTLRLGLHPSVTLLDLGFAVDRLLSAVKRQNLRGEASNAKEQVAAGPLRRRTPKAQPTRLVVYRHDFSVYSMPMDPEAFAILTSLEQRHSLGDAVEAATPDDADEVEWPARIKRWFTHWMSLGWFCRL